MASDNIPMEAPTPTMENGPMDEKNGLPTEVETEVANKPPSAPPPPDGGLDAWLTILGTSLVALATFGLVRSFLNLAH
jgi:hypothetical protein